MSFFSDLFEGNFNNLGNDITHAPSSLIAHPDELAETIGSVGLLAGGLAFAPEIAGALGIGEAGAIGAGAGVDAGLAADLGIGDIGAASAADIAAGAGGAADLGLAGDALAFAPGGADVLSLGGGGDALSAIDSFAPVGGGPFDTAGAGIGADVTSDPAVASYATSPAAGAGAGAAPAGGGAVSTPAVFADTDAELAGATTGTAPAATPAAAGGGGVTSALSSTLASPWTRLALAGAPLALALGMGQPSLPPGAQQLQNQALALQQTGLTDLQNARSGILNAGQTAVIAQARTDLTNSWRQTLYNQGVQDPTKDARWPQIEATIDSQVTQQTAQLIQQNITNALAETGQASTALTSIAQMQFQADQNFTSSLINATKSLGLAAGLSQGPTFNFGKAA